MGLRGIFDETVGMWILETGDSFYDIGLRVYDDRGFQPVIVELTLTSTTGQV